MSDDTIARVDRLEADVRDLRGIVHSLANGRCACGMHDVKGDTWAMQGETHGPALCAESSGTVLAEVKKPA